MGSSERRLIVNADDFGRSSAINHAVIRAHQEGILTTASLMVNGDAADEAVGLARQNPKLGVGLHLTLVSGKATLTQTKIPGLVDAQNNFSEAAVRTGLAYFFRPSLVPQLHQEIQAQFQKFSRTGLRLDHLNGHLNLHLHPTIFSMLVSNAHSWGITAMRLTRDRFWLNAKMARGHWFYRVSHAFVFTVLSRSARPQLKRHRIRHAPTVFGLLQNGRVDEGFVAQLLAQLPRGDSELYSHPSLDVFKHELDALISPRVRRLVQEQNIKLIRYQDL